MRKFYSAFALSILTSLTLIVGFTSPAHAVEPNTLEKQITSLHNKARANHKLGKLQYNKCLDNFAERQAKRQALKKEMFHQDLGPILNKCKFYSIGENVAYGYKNAKSVQKAWMNSPGHRSNILGASYSKVGVGVAKGKNGYLYYAVVFGG